MEAIATPWDFILANHPDFDLKMVCRILEVDTHIDSSHSVGRQNNVHYFDTELDFCIYFEAEAYNGFENFRVIGRVSFGQDRDAQKAELQQYGHFLRTNEAVLITSRTYTLVEGEIAVYDPEILGLGFPFGDR